MKNKKKTYVIYKFHLDLAETKGESYIECIISSREKYQKIDSETVEYLEFYSLVLDQKILP